MFIPGFCLGLVVGGVLFVVMGRFGHGFSNEFDRGWKDAMAYMEKRKGSAGDRNFYKKEEK